MSDTVEPLLERFGTLRMKAVSDTFHERSLVYKSSMPAALEQTYGVCGPETSVADAGVEAARWDVSITDEDSSETSIGKEDGSETSCGKADRPRQAAHRPRIPELAC